MKISKPSPLKIFIFFLVAMLPVELAAQNQGDEWKIRVGGATIAADLPWKALDGQIASVPYINASYGNWSFGVENLIRYQASASADVFAFVGLNLRDEAYNSDYSLLRKESKAKVFDGYESPEPEAIVQAGVSWHFLHASIEQDISNKSQSLAAQASIDIPLYRNQRGLMIKGNLGARWLSEDYVNYYYGISRSQENESVGRSYYQTNSATNYVTKLNVLYPINMRWAIMAEVSLTKLDDPIVDSPLIDDDSVMSAIVSITYQF